MLYIHLAKAFLVLASLFFYAYWKMIYLPLLLASMLINYALARCILKHTFTPYTMQELEHTHICNTSLSPAHYSSLHTLQSGNDSMSKLMGGGA
ncbi:hypothetical protein OQH61_09395 [Helicobacter sp. MIT 21-1697]|uniref:hypothetical protein n=1 Tax=Helicobacter sp. MIT 21-1697 TaxID=2993733 RepID=UPI00224ADDCA|nr:hypothetical protein [Helicobacter sp. MIT 21-1697]MCX2717946.1 hypothetical protein [Helicobacter sp. MIT 21-1697]